jgi:hypothetical protein
VALFPPAVLVMTRPCHEGARARGREGARARGRLARSRLYREGR